VICPSLPPLVAVADPLPVLTLAALQQLASA